MSQQSLNPLFFCILAILGVPLLHGISIQQIYMFAIASGFSHSLPDKKIGRAQTMLQSLTRTIDNHIIFITLQHSKIFGVKFV